MLLYLYHHQWKIAMDSNYHYYLPKNNYLPKNTPIATLLIVHGMAEHQGRYSDFAQFLAEHQIAVLTFDHLGHGQQAYDNNCLGYLGNPNPAELMIDNVMDHANLLAQKFPSVPHFILGHSMGSFIVRCIIQRFGEQFDGAIIMGTSDFNPLASAFVPITKNLNRFTSKRTNAALDKALNTFNNLPFRKEPDLKGFNWLNSNPKQVQAYIDDKLCGFQFTNNGYFALMALMQEGTQKDWFKKVPKNLPLLFVSGKDDPIGQMGKGVPRIAKRLAKNQFKAVTVKQYPTMRHEILLEDNHQLVYEDILAWMQQHLQ